MMRKGDLKFGDIVWTGFDPSVGHEFQDKRPAVVIQSDAQLQASNLVTVIPLTSKIGNRMPDDIMITPDAQNNLRSDSIAKVYSISSFDYQRFDKKIGEIDTTTVSAIKDYLKKHFDL